VVPEAIRELREVPAGTLYSALMTDMDLDTFEKLVDSHIRESVTSTWLP
jgi:hypothetical protein